MLAGNITMYSLIFNEHQVICLSKMDSDYPLLSSKPSYAIKEFINFNVKTNSRNVILLNYKLRQYIKGKTFTHIKLSICKDHQ
jgi:hypothetical protein